MLSVLDLFSGIGGFSLGLEWARGFQTVAFCENDLSCHKVLNKHWPDIPIYSDIKELTLERLKKDRISKIDIVTGGFPCQDISQAGKRKGIKASRSGLWTEMYRLIHEVRPRYAIMENVAALCIRGLESVLQDLTEIGYDAEWHCIPASAIGAPHQRDRIWIIAYPSGKRRGGGDVPEADRRSGDTGGKEAKVFSDPDSRRQGKGTMEKPEGYGKVKVSTGRTVNGNKVSNPDSIRFKGKKKQGKRLSRPERDGKTGECLWQNWTSEPDVGRVAYGISDEMDRLLKNTSNNHSCIKQRVFAIIKIDNKFIIGENQIQVPQNICPRDRMSTGKGYSLCKNICRQQNHAEIDLIHKVGGDLKGNDVYIVGHYYVCNSCFVALEKANVGNIIFPTRNRINRLRQLGNSVVPQIPYLIGMAILKYEKTSN